MSLCNAVVFAIVDCEVICNVFIIQHEMHGSQCSVLQQSGFHYNFKVLQQDAGVKTCPCSDAAINRF